jgi:hypothetical protein
MIAQVGGQPAYGSLVLRMLNLQHVTTPSGCVDLLARGDFILYALMPTLQFWKVACTPRDSVIANHETLGTEGRCMTHDRVAIEAELGGLLLQATIVYCRRYTICTQLHGSGCKHRGSAWASFCLINMMHTYPSGSGFRCRLR